jgi:hypothetical protein
MISFKDVWQDPRFITMHTANTYPKKRRVHFSDISTFKLIPDEITSDCQESDQSTCGANTIQAESQACPAEVRVQDDFAALSQDELPKLVDSDFRFSSICEKLSPLKINPQQLPIRTKLLDGSGSVTLATYTLVCMMVKQRTIEHKQVIDIVLHFSSSMAAPFLRQPTSPLRTVSKASDLVEAEGSSCNLSDIKLRDHRLLCAGIQSRLATLRERIHASGKAVLRPSNAIMGPPFAPALDFLRDVVREVSASAAAAEHSSPTKRTRED